MRSVGWKVLLFWAALSGVACSPTANLGSIGDGGASLLWKATFETGDISEWLGDDQGGILSNIIGNDGLVNPAATSAVMGHNGSKWAGVFVVDPAGGNVSECYLNRVLPSPRAAYYSAWFYVPSSILVESYLSLWHMRETPTGRVQDLIPIWDVNLYPTASGLYAQLYNFGVGGDATDTPQVNTLFPRDTWVQLEVLFVKATDATGRIAVWQNGTPIVGLDLSDIQTVLSDAGWLQWNVGGASTALALPLPDRVYADDAAISTVRLGPNVVF